LLPFTVLFIPLLDLLMAIFRRLAAGRSPFASDREHLHHRLLNMGNSHRRTAFILYLWTATAAVPTVLAAFWPFWVATLAAIALFSASLLLIVDTKRRGRESRALQSAGAK
jgi:UDP-GlcNAc:undecaprenyl-phosphate GlcNAc-1-phosphate transferase